MEIERRPEYIINSDSKIIKVLETFNFPFDEISKYRMDQVFCCIDFTDQIFDDPRLTIDNKNNLVDYLSLQTDKIDIDLSKKVLDNFSIVRAIVEENNAQFTIRNLGTEMLSIHEQITNVKDPYEYIKLTKKEALMTTQIVTNSLNMNFNSETEKFLTHANMMLNLLDNLKDLDDDYKSREIKLEPCQKVRNILRFSIAKELAFLLSNYPNKKGAIRMTRKYLGMIKK